MSGAFGDTVSTVSRRLRILLAVLSGLLVMTVAGCKADASPTVAPTRDLREVPDQIDISTPDGWVRLDPDKGETADELTIAKAAPSSDNVPGINVMHYSPDIVATFVSPDTLEEDLHRYRDQSMKDWTAESTRYYSDTKTLPDRTIDGVIIASRTANLVVMTEADLTGNRVIGPRGRRLAAKFRTPLDPRPNLTLASSS